MTTLQAEINLLRFFKFRENIIVHCVSNFLMSFECDLVVLSKSNYATVVEIKVSKSDLRNDLKKKHINQISNPNRFDFYYGKIKYFYYAVPSILVEDAINQIPNFAGIIDLDSMDVIRKPKQLSKFKWSDKMRMELARLGAMRILTLKQNINEMKQFVK